MAQHEKRIAKLGGLGDPADKNKAQVIRRETTKAAGYSSVYTNDLQVQTGPWDVRMVLGEMGEARVEDGNPVAKVTELLEVRMSPQLAKRLTLILIQQLKRYENNFGPIPSVKDE